MSIVPFSSIKNLTLPQLADQAREIEAGHQLQTVEYQLALGEVLSVARSLCDDPDCGVAGANPDARFGSWVSANFVYSQHGNSLRNYRRLWEAFGHLPPETVLKIGKSNCYALAGKDAAIRDRVIGEAVRLPDGDHLTAKQVSALIQPQEA